MKKAPFDVTYLVFNATDGVYASPDPMKAVKAARFVVEFRARFHQQGYYKTARGERIAPADIQFEFHPTP